MYCATRSVTVSPVISAVTTMSFRRRVPSSSTASISASRVPKWYWITPQVTPARSAMALELAR
jgi:hypothetical protein